MAFIDTAYVDAHLGQQTRLGYAPDSAAFNAYEASARAKVKAMVGRAGYRLEDTTDDDLVKLMTLGQWYIMAGGLRHGLDVPPTVKESVDLLDAVSEGRMRLVDTQPSLTGGKGGNAVFRNPGSRSFSKSKMRGW